MASTGRYATSTAGITNVNSRRTGVVVLVGHVAR
jgi:hypothetical protein